MKYSVNDRNMLYIYIYEKIDVLLFTQISFYALSVGFSF